MVVEHEFIFPKQKPARLDIFLRDYLPDMSRQFIKSLIDQKQVWVNGNEAAKSGMMVRPDMVVKIRIPEKTPSKAQAEAIDLDILYEDHSLLVLNKPINFVVHPAPGHSGGTLVNALLHHCKDSLSGIGGEVRPGIVHRLDRDTSGVMVVAKSDKAHRYISKQFADHSIERVYHALVFGVPSPLSGSINAAIGRHRIHRKKMALRPDSTGKSAITDYKLIKVLAGGCASLIECRPKTGRTHQIRVHMASLGHSLYGDPLYSASSPFTKKFKQACPFFKRQALHAAILGFIHPEKQIFMRFETPPPQDFLTLQATLDF